MNVLAGIAHYIDNLNRQKIHNNYPLAMFSISKSKKKFLYLKQSERYNDMIRRWMVLSKYFPHEMDIRRAAEIMWIREQIFFLWYGIQIIDIAGRYGKYYKYPKKQNISKLDSFLEQLRGISTKSREDKTRLFRILDDRFYLETDMTSISLDDIFGGVNLIYYRIMKQRNRRTVERKWDYVFDIVTGSLNIISVHERKFVEINGKIESQEVKSEYIGNGDTFLTYACQNNLISRVIAFVNRGDKIELPNKIVGNYPQHFAAMLPDSTILTFLLSRGADPNILNNKTGDTPLLLAIWGEYSMNVKSLLQSGVITNRSDNSGNYPIHYAVMLRDSEILRMLLDDGVDVNVVNNQSLVTPLMLGVFSGTVENVDIMIQHGSKTDSRDLNGNSISQLAIMSNNFDMMKYFLDNNLFSMQLNRDGESYYDLSKKNSTIYQFITDNKNQKTQRQTSLSRKARSQDSENSSKYHQTINDFIKKNRKINRINVTNLTRQYDDLMRLYQNINHKKNDKPLTVKEQYKKYLRRYSESYERKTGGN